MDHLKCAHIGTGLLHEGQFGALIKEHFPNASRLDLYGAGVTLTSAGEIVSISCQGRTVRMEKMK